MQSNQSSVEERNKKALKVTVWTKFAPGSGLSTHETYQTLSKQNKITVKS